MSDKKKKIKNKAKDKGKKKVSTLPKSAKNESGKSTGETKNKSKSNMGLDPKDLRKKASDAAKAVKSGAKDALTAKETATAKAKAVAEARAEAEAAVIETEKLVLAGKERAENKKADRLDVKAAVETLTEFVANAAIDAEEGMSQSDVMPLGYENFDDAVRSGGGSHKNLTGAARKVYATLKSKGFDVDVNHNGGMDSMKMVASWGDSAEAGDGDVVEVEGL